MATGEDLVHAVGTRLKLNTHNCKRCGQPIRRGQDFLRTHYRAIALSGIGAASLLPCAKVTRTRRKAFKRV
jgi:hypothetical protein